MTIRCILLLLIFSCVCFSCGHNISSKEDLIRFIHRKDSGLKKENDTQSNIRMAMVYMPYQLFPVNVKSDGQDNFYFSLQLSSDNKPLSTQVSREMYGELIQLFLFDFQQYITYSYGASAHTVKHISYNQHDQNPYYDNLIVTIPRDAAFEGSKVLRFTIKEFGFQSGSSSFSFKTKDINRVNGLIID
ncbi:hypothetical protein FXV77_10655 [Sphingobacterium phlebotomi]|uniref:Lipoprotein n=1 Tax=Sphingobacterium phlebotomi TaxID=2605433 RepID=A0A5D4H6M6_9SPHI|nr:hypothetical protein [Sphingobacterium phlebotomi]TYR36358.1 hypothetical protein FXV77_10655 [Sphingobacterium phlebotomi]